MIVSIPKERYDLYTLGTKRSDLQVIVREVSWWSDLNEQLIGTVTYDLTDEDYGWVLLARDELGKFRAANLKCSIKSKLRAEVE